MTHRFLVVEMDAENYEVRGALDESATPIVGTPLSLDEIMVLIDLLGKCVGLGDSK